MPFHWPATLASRLPLRVLVCDDNIVNQIVSRGQLELLGYDVDVVNNGAEALARCREKPPDMVLMDLDMPVMDGLEAIRLIKSRWPQVRIVVLTMYTTHRADALAAGADAFLVKGCTAEAIREALQSGEAGKRAPPPPGGGRPQLSVD